MDYVIPLRFKPGDHVVVRPDLNINTVYQTFGGKNAGYRTAPNDEYGSPCGNGI